MRHGPLATNNGEKMGGAGLLPAGCRGFPELRRSRIGSPSSFSFSVLGATVIRRLGIWGPRAHVVLKPSRRDEAPSDWGRLSRIPLTVAFHDACLLAPPALGQRSKFAQIRRGGRMALLCSRCVCVWGVLRRCWSHLCDLAATCHESHGVCCTKAKHNCFGRVRRHIGPGASTRLA